MGDGPKPMMSLPYKRKQRPEEPPMKFGARNQIRGTVTSVQKGDVMSLVKFEVTDPVQLASVLTTESLDDLALKKGDVVLLVVKAIHVLPVRP